MIRPHRIQVAPQGLWVDRKRARVILLVKPSSFIAPILDERRASIVDFCDLKSTRRSDVIAMALACLIVGTIALVLFGTL
jgi:hypothetical protein